MRRSRADLAAEVARLRADGLLCREVAELLGISRSYAAALSNDPDGAKDRARKASYRGTCSRCGNPTDGSNGAAKAPDRCAKCAAVERHEAQYWTADRVVNVIQRFAVLHGRPPTANEWVRVDHANGYPCRASVYVTSSNSGAPFPKWADAIEAAGFPRPRPGVYAHDGERGLQHIQRSVLAMLRAQWGPETPTGQIIRETGHMYRERVAKALRSLERRGLARRVRHGHWTAT